MAQHTPGQWTVLSGGAGSWTLSGPEGEVIAQRPGWPHRADESRANARLIAAAPETAAERDRLREVNADLLAACREVLRCAALPETWAAPLRAVIARAEGRS